MPSKEQDERWMREALELARFAQEQGEVPVGAVLVQGEDKISSGWNQSIGTCDPTAHAEIVALRQAAKALCNYRLPNTTLYVTLEPCILCAGALVQARIERLVFAAREPRAGAVVSVFNLLDRTELNHRVHYHEGPCTEEASILLKQFFKNRR